MKIYPLIALLALLSLAQATVEPGDQAPEFSLKDSKDKFQKLSNYAGKFVVLEWMNPECPFIKKHYSGGNMQSLQKEPLRLRFPLYGQSVIQRHKGLFRAIA